MTSTNKVALVTGASSGIGKATAIALQASGYITYATARHPHALTLLQALELHPLQLDVTDEESMRAAIHTIEAENGGVDVLVNNAGYGEMGPIEEISMERVRRQFETNVFGLIRLSQLVLPSMRRQGWGRIVNVSSMGGEFTTPLAGIYHASKYAVESISDALRFEVEPFGVDVIIIQPGAVRTPLAEATVQAIHSLPDSPYTAQLEGFQRMAEANIRQGSAVLEPEDVASVIVEAVMAEQPLTRYKVGVLAEQMVMMRRHFSDRDWDAMFRHQFGLPESVKA
jgi:NAD(P)-dependent dehydrogenase (short-subunit alcohol dehydrogenase family)